MWNERYTTDEYIYGTEPNDFLAEHASMLGGPVLSIAEGEGRNAVFLASLGLDVLGVDGSPVGLAKARSLARSKGLEIRTQVADLAEYEPSIGGFGSVISIFAHLPSSVRRRLYPLLTRAVVPGGILLLEAYSEAQVANDTGGPKDSDMLMSVEKIEAELPGFEPLHLQELERDVVEGRYHTGTAHVVQFIGRKRA